MLTNKADRQQRYKRWRRRLYTTTVIVCTVLAVAAYAWDRVPMYLALRQYTPQEGDILFQSLPRSHVVNAIEGATGSCFSHCGIVAKWNGDWVVYEAFRTVRQTPLDRFVLRGREHGFAVYRLKPPFRQSIPSVITNVRQYLGRDYDLFYQMDDDRIYCTELIYKAFRDASGEQLGHTVRVAELNWRPYEAIIQHFHPGPVPIEREVITPRDMAAAEQLQLVFSYKIAEETSKMERQPVAGECGP